MSHCDLVISYFVQTCYRFVDRTGCFSCYAQMFYYFVFSLRKTDLKFHLNLTSLAPKGLIIVRFTCFTSKLTTLKIHLYFVHVSEHICIGGSYGLRLVHRGLVSPFYNTSTIVKNPL